VAQTVNHECALVALFEDAASATHSSVYACLATRARQHGLDFFEQAISEAEDQKGPLLKLVWVLTNLTARETAYADLLKRLRPNDETNQHEKAQ